MWILLTFISNKPINNIFKRGARIIFGERIREGFSLHNPSMTLQWTKLLHWYLVLNLFPNVIKPNKFKFVNYTEIKCMFYMLYRIYKRNVFKISLKKCWSELHVIKITQHFIFYFWAQFFFHSLKKNLETLDETRVSKHLETNNDFNVFLSLQIQS